ncbi:hypothetical protein M3Y99_00972500 [Aphelenchoides fujianensis]|nr:hypothetical protein M3Y99_00972500 [Aphelenchoides fujianensis]
MTSFLVANAVLSQTITWPITARLPAIIGCLIDVLAFKTVAGRRNFALLGAGIAVGVVGVVLVGLSKSALTGRESAYSPHSFISLCSFAFSSHSSLPFDHTRPAAMPLAAFFSRISTRIAVLLVLMGVLGLLLVLYTLFECAMVVFLSARQLLRKSKGKASSEPDGNNLEATGKPAVLPPSLQKEESGDTKSRRAAAKTE